MTDAAAPPPPEPPPPDRTGRRPWRPTWVDWLHAVVLVGIVVALRIGGDRWAVPTFLAYAPRWPYLMPGALLVLVAPLRRRWPWLTLGVGGIAAVVLLDAHAHWPTTPAGERLRVLTLNVDGGNTDGRYNDPVRIGRLISDTRPDVILLQEWSMPGPPPLPPGDWQTRRLGNVMLLARHPITGVATLPSGVLLGDSELLGAKLTLAGGRSLWVFTPHLETPRRGFLHLLQRRDDALTVIDQITARRQKVSEAAVAFVRRTAGDADVLIGGDFNLVADGRIFATTWAHWQDAFATAGNGVGGTKLQDGWRPRIDHVLLGNAWQATACWVGPDVGSDHLPLLADVIRR